MHEKEVASEEEPPMKPYASDLSDAEWAILEPLIPPAKPGGRPRSVNMRQILNGIFYVLRSGGAWRLLPHDYPAWSGSTTATPEQDESGLKSTWVGRLSSSAIPAARVACESGREWRLPQKCWLRSLAHAAFVICPEASWSSARWPGSAAIGA